MNKRITALALITTLTLTLFTGCAGTKENSASLPEEDLNQVTEINVGITNYALPAVIAKEKGFFEEEFGSGIEYNLEFFSNGGPAAMEALSSGSLDLAYTAELPIVQANANSSQIKFFAQYQVNSEPWAYLYTTKDSGIESISDLKGHTVGYAAGTILHQYLFALLESEGLSADDVELVSIPSNQLTALQAGTIDAAVIGSINDVEDENVVAIISSEGYLDQVNYLCGDSNFAEANPDIMARYLKVLQESAEWIADNQEETIQIIMDYMQKEESDVRSIVTKSNFNVTWSDGNVSGIENTIDFSYGQGSIDKKTAVEDLIDTTYVEAAGFAK